MKKCILTVILCALLLTGCSINKEAVNKKVIIDYKGTSPSWDISYKVTGNEEVHDSYFTFKYTGQDNGSVKEVKYSIDGPREGENGQFIYEDSNGYGYTDKMKLTGGLPDDDRTIKVKAEWNGNTEILVLNRIK